MVYRRYILKPESPFRTPLRSDTLAGHLLWALSITAGEERLREVFGHFEQGRPPFLLGGPFPAGFLPRPPVPWTVDDFADECDLALVKDFLKLPYVTRELIVDREYDTARALQEYARNTDRFEPFGPPGSQAISEMHTAVNRESGTVEAHQLFSTHRRFFSPQATFDLYVKLGDTMSEAEFESLLSVVGQWGYGADTSVGCGCFTFQRDETFDEHLFSSTQDHWWMLLSYWAPQESLADAALFWQGETKWGRIYNPRIANGADKMPNVFKFPLFRLTPGALFTNVEQFSHFQLLSIAPDERVRDFALPLFLPLRLSETDRNYCLEEVTL